MSYTVTKFPHGTFSWTDIMSTDIDKSKEFMTQIMGWTYKDMPTPIGVDYTMFYLDKHAVAGGSPMPPNMKNVPSHWNSYVTVDDLDALAAQVESLGGKITMPTMNVMDSGRMVGISDPTGAMLMLWEPKSHIGAGIVNIAGAMGWNELYTRDVEAAKKFYAKLLGWTYDVSPEMDNYTTIKNNGRMNGGIMEIKPEWGDMPPSWAIYFTVESIENTTNKAKNLGGSIIGEVMTVKTVGQFAVIKDPSGAVFTVIQMESEPETWQD